MKSKTIIISDLHLWSPDAKYHQLIDFLQTHPCENLVLNGDIIDGKHIRYFWSWKKEYDVLFDTLQAICKKNLTQITYIRGNHEKWTNKIKVPRGFHVQEDMIYTSHGKKYYICHGDQFDSTFNKAIHRCLIISFLTSLIGVAVYRANRKYNQLRHSFGLHYSSLLKPIKNAGNYLLRGSKKEYESKLIQKALGKNCDGIICGHNHKPENKMLNKGIHYLNSWEWIETCSALIEDEEGKWEIIYYKNH